jgi:hypothetical protein
MKPPNRLKKKAYQVLFFLGVSYLWVSIILFFGVGPIKTTFWGFHSVAVILGPSFLNIVRFDYLLQKKDSRILAEEWIQRNFPEGTSVFQTGGE